MRAVARPGIVAALEPDDRIRQLVGQPVLRGIAGDQRLERTGPHGIGRTELRPGIGRRQRGGLVRIVLGRLGCAAPHAALPAAARHPPRLLGLRPLGCLRRRLGLGSAACFFSRSRGLGCRSVQEFFGLVRRDDAVSISALGPGLRSKNKYCRTNDRNRQGSQEMCQVKPKLQPAIIERAGWVAVEMRQRCGSLSSQFRSECVQA